MAIDTNSTTPSILNSLIEIRDLLKISKERGDAELHWRQISHIFEDLKQEILPLVEKEKSQGLEFEKMPIVKLLKEIDDAVWFPLVWEYKQDLPFRSVREEFEITDCIPEVPDAPFPQDTVDCVFITDDGYVNMTAVSINSIRNSRNKETKVRIHIVAAALSEYSEKLFKLLEEKDFSIEIIRVERAVLERLSTLHQYVKGGNCMATPAALLKFSLPELLPNLNRVLYLDGDTLALRDLKGVFQTPLSNNYVAAVTDGWVVTGYSEEIKRMGKWLFNSGMMLLNLDLMRQDNMSEKLLEAKKRSTNFRLMDQPILNALFAGRVKLLDWRYNFLPVWYYQKSQTDVFEKPEFPQKVLSMWGVTIKSVKELLDSDITIAHFAGTEKPWNTPALPFAEVWMNGVKEFSEMRMHEFIRSKKIPFVSIVVPIYNAGRYLSRCLNSLCNQTLKEIEIICINDGSTDDSLSILKKYAEQDPRIVIITQENQGNGASRNLGIRKAQGQYVGFVDADDFVDKDFFEKLFIAALKQKTFIAKALLKRVQDGQASTPIDISRRDLPLFARFYYNFTSAIFDVRFLRENDIEFCEKSLIGEDLLFLLSLCLKTDSITFVEGTFYYYVKNEESVSHAREQKYFEDNLSYVETGIDLLNKRGIWDEAYYFWIRERLVQLAKVVLPQIDDNPTLRNFKSIFTSRLKKLFQKVKRNKQLLTYFPQDKKLYNFLKSSDDVWVSVVVPVYNTEKYLRECLDSICRQDLQEIEVICVNDGSTDASLDILKEYQAKDSRIKIFSQRNAGLGAARNFGLDQSTGEFVYFMDSDDVSPQGALSKMYSELKRDSLDTLFFSANSFYETPELEQSHAHYKTYYTRKEFDAIDGQTLAVKLQEAKSHFVSACCYCCRREFLVKNRIRFPENCLYEDNAAFWSILKCARKAKSISDPLFLRRVRQGSIMTKRKLDFRNFEGYAKIISIFEQIACPKKPLFEKLLRCDASSFSKALIRFYQQISPEDRARSRELLCNELRNSEWLNPVRENIARIEGIDLPMAEDSTAPAKKPLPQVLRKNLCLSVKASTPGSSKTLPRLLVRLGAMFIPNKAARKRFRERHMDLTPKDGVDINVYPEMHRDSALKRLVVRLGALFIFDKQARKAFRATHLNLIPRDGRDINLYPKVTRDSAAKRVSVRVASLFIFNKQARKAFREKHLNLTPKDGIDVRALSPEERRLRKQKKRERNVFRRLFNAIIPASRAKIAHTEKHLFLHTEQQTARILAEIRASRAQSERLFNGIKMELVRIREQNERTMRELGSAQKDALTQIRTELASKIEALDSRVEACIKSGREIFQQQNARDEDLVKTFDEVKSQVSGAVERYSGLEEILRESFLKRLENSGVVPNSLEFRTFGDLAHCIRKNLHKIPSDIDLVVGNPRSGIVPAYMIALFMNRRCCSLDEFLSGATGSVGIRPVEKRETRKVLIVDDSCYNGTAMEKVREKLKSCDGKYEFIYMAVYGRKDSADKLDFYLEPVEGRRVWQWNCLNHSLAGTACFDMDGVLCVDPAPTENDDGEKYIRFIKTATPLYIPTYEIHTIVTSRLEKYRAITEEWLRVNGVRYKELVMLDLPSAEERRRLKCHATFKADEYKKRPDTTLFVESEDWQAKEIAFLTGKQVLCVQTDKIY